MREQDTGHVEQGSWIGHDMVLVRAAAVGGRGYQIVEVGVNAENFPFHNKLAEESFRSRLAQAGITGENVWDQIQDTIALRNGQTTALLRIRNNAERPYILPEGLGLLRFVYLDEKSAVVGDELSESIGEEIKIDSRKGIDWDFVFDEQVVMVKEKETKIKTPARIWFLLRTDRKRIKPGRVVTINGENGDYRSEIDEIAENAEESSEEMHYFDQTVAAVKLNGVHAKLHSVGTIYSGDGLRMSEAQHYNSTFFESGRTDWNLRAEFYGRTVRYEAPNAITLRLYRTS